jgi:hypothetical protein
MRGIVYDANKPFMLSAVMLSDIMQSAVAPLCTVELSVDIYQLTADDFELRLPKT